MVIDPRRERFLSSSREILVVRDLSS